jgi:hypothetical protein
MYVSCIREGSIEVLNISYVAGSILDGIIGIFHRLNPSGRTVALGSIQLLKDDIKKVKDGKTVALQVWTIPEGSRRLRLADFKTFGT